jgi:acyl-coenzyme A synthetase/AMP-(fatty) acid ligase
MDDEGFLYFVGRRDDMIKTSGYRVSPTEVEEIAYATGLVEESAAIGVPHPVLGQAIVLVVTPAGGTDVNLDDVIEECKRRLPTFMVPAHVSVKNALPRNSNGKIDRKALMREFEFLFKEKGQ